MLKEFMMKRGILLILILSLCLQTAIVPPVYATEEEAVTVTSEARVLKGGDRGDDVRALQERLRALKYLDAKATGNFLSQTEKAVRAVQKAYGMAQTGEVDNDLLEIIYSDEFYRPLKKDDKGSDVSELQGRLSVLGFYLGNISGVYLDATVKAVRDFQALNGLEASGAADIATQIKLFGDDVIMPTPDPNATPAPSPAPTAPPDTSFPGKLQYGSKQKAVTTLQEQLGYLGYLDRKPTGGFYKQTQSAVKSFQKQNGLVSDGVVGEETWLALFAPDAVLPHNTPRPAPEPTPVPYFIEVDVANQLVKVFRRDGDGGFTDLHKVFTASTGTEKFPSDVGTWVLTGRRARWALFPTWGGGYAQYWTRINSSIAFHSFLYTPDRTEVKMASVNKLGRRASHGCIRLTLNDAKWIYDNIGEGTEVWIHEDGLIDPELKYANRLGEFSQKLGNHVATPEPAPRPDYDMAVTPAGGIRELKVGAEGDDVFWLQNRLKELGYYLGSVTGQYREGTRDAVKAYQRDNKLRVNGTANKETQELLYSQTAQAVAALQPTPAPTAIPAPATDYVVGEGK